jgi:peptidoglycan hydrolase CwlO-like protein
MTLIKSNGNGESILPVKPSLIKWGIPLTFIITIGITVSGWIYNAGGKDKETQIAIDRISENDIRLKVIESANDELEVYQEKVETHEKKLEVLNGDVRTIREDVNAIKQDLREIGTDIKWIKENLK